MQLTLAPPFDFAPFARRLAVGTAAPLAVGFSGGGDSLALLLATKAWADGAGRPLIALTVDHGLQPAGARWAVWAAERCSRLGVAHETLRWEAEKPTAGLPAAARAARHALLAAAARRLGAQVLALGHTADDILEARQMRASGSSVPSPREWSPSPAWPQGRGVFLLRPLLAARRADLRAWLAAQGETWIDDPANDDPRFARAAARRRLAETCSVISPQGAAICDLTDIGSDAGGAFHVFRDALAGAPAAMARRRLSALCLCASGGVRPPRGEALDRLAARLAQGGDFTASLAGARIEARGVRLLICREAGEFSRSGPSISPLPLGESVFDGRFLVETGSPGWSIGPLKGLARRLPGDEQAQLAEFPAAVRPTLPVVTAPGRAPSCPVLAQGGPVRAQTLVGERLAAALGGVLNEAAMRRVAK